MNQLTRYGVAPFLSFLLVFVPLIVGAQPPNVSLSASHGNGTTDWLVHPYPLFVAPGQPGSSAITIDPRYRDLSLIERRYTGRLWLSANCCFIPGAQGSVGPGVDISISPQRSVSRGEGSDAPAWLRERPGGNRLTPSSGFLDIAGQSTSATLNVTAGPVSGLVPGTFGMVVRAEDPTQGINQSIQLLVNVLPPWPPDGPAPACTPGVEVLPISSFTFNTPSILNIYSWKANNPTRTSITFAARSLGNPIGLEFTIRDEGRNPPLAPNQAVIRFTNTKGQPVGIRSSDSRNCAVPGLQRWAHVGNAPTTFTITTADTTTLVFSRTVCRASFIFCWGRHGSDDVLQFSEGAFWTLFGGRAVDIETVGAWDKAIIPFFGSANLEIKSP